MLYYWARLHGGQLLAGEDFRTLCPSFSFAFLARDLFPGDAHHHRFGLWDVDQRVRLCPDIEVHTIELGKFRLTAEQVRTPAERWCFFLKHGAEMDLDALPATLDTPPIRQALEVLVRISQDQIERLAFDDYMKRIRDEATRRAVDREEAIAEFREKEAPRLRADGRGEGAVVGQVQLLQGLLGLPVASDEELYARPLEDLRRLRDELQQRLASRSNGGT